MKTEITPEIQAKLDDAERMARLGRHVMNFALRGGWDPSDGEGCFEFIQRHSYAVGYEDAGGKIPFGGTDPKGSHWPLDTMYPQNVGALDGSSFSRAHSVCFDAGIPAADINTRLEQLRAMVTNPTTKLVIPEDRIRFDFVNSDGNVDSKVISHDEMRQRYETMRAIKGLKNPE